MTSSSTPAARVRGLVKRYDGDVLAVDGIDLEIGMGECFGLLGPNGAGKTTTIEILEGLLEPTSGEVWVLGKRWQDDPDGIRQRIGVVLQETRLADRLHVDEVIELFRSFYDKGTDVEQVIDSLQLGDKRHAWVSKLSGGQRQRLAVACGLVADPDLLFLDEPTTGLDPQSRRSLWEVIHSLRGRGKTVLLTTHYMDEAERLCDRVAIVDRGKIIALGTPAELIRSLGTAHVVELLTEPQLSPAELEGIVGTSQARREADGRLLLAASAPHVALPALFTRVAERGAKLVHLSTRSATLEDVFVSLTGRHLRED